MNLNWNRFVRYSGELQKNHAFSNANKRTASIVLVALLEQINYIISDNDLINITLDVAEHN